MIHRLLVSGILPGLVTRRFVPHTFRVLARRNATDAKFHRLAAVTTPHHTINYMIRFIHVGIIGSGESLSVRNGTCPWLRL
jgi:hypothetical protein